MNNSLRKVDYSAYYTINGVEYAKAPKKGFFHSWGHDYVVENEKAFALTFGIIEDEETGQIFKVPVDRIQFKK